MTERLQHTEVLTADPAVPAPEGPPPLRSARPKWVKNVRSGLKHLGLILFGFVMLYPLLWMVASSIKPDA